MKDFYKAKHVQYTNMFSENFNLNRIQNVCYDKRFVIMFNIQTNDSLFLNYSFKLNQYMWNKFRLDMMKKFLTNLKEI
mgnify:CR=1 FL=1